MWIDYNGEKTMFLQEENKKLSMDNFIFPEKLRSKLQFLIDNPEKMPRVLCFYGNPGNGKTTFAKYLASKISKEVHYYDSNSFKMDGTSSSAILKSIKKSYRTVSIYEFVEGNEHLKDRPFNKAFIIDEFHNSSAQTQDGYKIAVEEISNTGSIFIFILNTDKKETYERRVTPAMRSRFYDIKFDLEDYQIDEVCELVKKKYPQIPNETVRELVTANDMRRLMTEAKILG